MTRINTNLSSLTAQNALQTSQNELQTSLLRLSTGLRINSGADDPSGMIASTELQSNITSLNSAISNSQLAEQMIATADSGLGQVSSLLNNIQGLVTSAANTGTLSSDQVSADQSQIDSSLSAIDQIAQSTNFQGQNLLNGSLGFNTSMGSGANISSLQINQANLAAGAENVSVNVTAAAQQAALSANNIAAASGTGTAATATVQIDSTPGDTLVIQAPTASGAYNGVAVNFIEQAGVNAAGGPTASYNASTGALNITVDNTSTTTATAIADAVEKAGFTVTGTPAGTYSPGTAKNAAATPATATVTFADGGELQITATTPGILLNGTTIKFAEAAATADPVSASYNAGTTTLTVDALDNGGTTNLNALAKAIDADGTFTATVLNPGEYQHGVDVLTAGGGAATVNTVSETEGVGGTATLAFTTNTDGPNAATVNVIEAAGQGATPTAVWNPTANAGHGELDVYVDSSAGITTSLADIQSAVAKSGSPFTMSYTGATDVTGSGTAGTTYTGTAAAGTYNGLKTTVTPGTAAVTGADTTFSGGSPAAGGLMDDLTFQLSGAAGSQTFSFTEGATLNDIVSAITAQSGATGVSAATNNNDGLTFSSTGVGSSAFVGVNVISEDGSKAFTNNLTNPSTNAAATRATGSDVQGTINGITASGSGNTLSVNNANLSASVTLNAGTSGQSNFTITGGGALFQLGADVVSNQQARLGIQSVDTSSLGGSDGLLYTLGSGGTAALATNPSLASSIVGEAISQVANLRGRLGAFQSTTLESNVSSLTNTVQNLTSAQSSIQDADFAAESANLTRAQVLVQSGVAVLSVANKAPQNILALLQNL